MRTHALLLTTSVVALAACSACSSKESATGGSAGAYGGTFIYAQIGDVSDAFPPYIEDQNGRMVADLVFDRLAQINATLGTVGDKAFDPRLAKSWDWAKDSMSIAFHLDPRARWHDGKPVTASDVKYSFKVHSDPKAGAVTVPLLTNIDSVQVRDSATAVVWYKKHTPTEFYDFVYQIMILPEHVYGSIPLEQLHTSPQTKQLVGSGRFRLAKWQPGVRMDLVADTANYRGRPKLDRIVITPIADANAGMAQVLTGQSDFMQAFPVDQSDKLDSSKVARRIDFPTIGYAWLGFNLFPPKAKSGTNTFFGDVRVRRALSMAVDRKAMLNNVFGPSATNIGYGPFPAAVAYADSNLKLPPFDAAAASALLDSAGWRMGPNGLRVKNGVPLKFTILSTTTSLFRRRYSVLLQDALKRIGAQADIDAVDAGTFISRLNGGDFDAVLGTFNPDPDVGGALQSWGTKSIGSSNWMHYSNRTVDALLDSASASFDPAKSKSYSSRAFQQIADDAPAIWLYDVTLINGMNRRIEPARPISPIGWWLNLSDWSIPADKRIDRDRIGLSQPNP